MATDHNPCQLMCILISAVVVVATSMVIASALAHQYGITEPIPGLLRQDLQENAEDKPSPISPAPWLHWGWVVVFVWLEILVLHSFVSIFRTWGGVPVYTCPVLISTPMLLCFSLACAFNIGWFIANDEGLPSTACLMAILSTTTAWAAFAIALHDLEINLFRLKKAERFPEIWLQRLIVHNGLALYGQWCMFVAAFNIAVVMMHNDRQALDEDLSTVVAMSIMAIFIFGYFILDVTCLDHYTRFTVTPYIVNIVVVSACLFRQDVWESDDVNFLFLAGLLAFSLFMPMVKSACVACRIMRGSTYGSADITTMVARRSSPEDEGRYLLK